MIYALQGYYFQNVQHLGIAQLPESQGGARVVMVTALMGALFSGFIYNNPVDETSMVGDMVDPVGEAILSNIKLAEEKFEFKKRYIESNYEIDYVFEKKGEIWVGKWNIHYDNSEQVADSGTATCMIHKLPNALLEPPLFE